MHPEVNELIRAPYFDTYLKLLDSASIEEGLNHSSKELRDLLETIPDDQLDYSYAPGKWTVKQVIQHVIETEMIFNYRAIRIGREDVTQNLDGFEENHFAANAQTADMTNADLAEFFTAVRMSTKHLVSTFSATQLDKSGIASGHYVQVKALFLIQAGHTLHHLNVIRERYLK
ncbi:MAG: DinB family protein [Flavobacteriales bacterium]|nr:DinB family protein [Flavobacteriales bacterium]NCG30401.1 DUF664 domain-containing protein [Bacteroidota bacterium]MBT3964526.1 DinB family protein [Flavobacteriales bacterium]MBT4705770.1 DinB family protein [Flavobacteriales bacterium]MBT4930233.1 DinB family protein [Flavobacteriales bacterium]